MASSKDYLIYVLELLREVKGITYKKMMGEFVIYKEGVVFGGIYDDRFLVKKTKTGEELGLEEVIPYPTSKGMYLVSSEDPDEIKDLVINIYRDLQKGKN